MGLLASIMHHIGEVMSLLAFLCLQLELPAYTTMRVGRMVWSDRLNWGGWSIEHNLEMPSFWV